MKSCILLLCVILVLLILYNQNILIIENFDNNDDDYNSKYPGASKEVHKMMDTDYPDDIPKALNVDYDDELEKIAKKKYKKQINTKHTEDQRDMGQRDMDQRDMGQRDMGQRDMDQRDMGQRDMGQRDMGQNNDIITNDRLTKNTQIDYEFKRKNYRKPFNTIPNINTPEFEPIPPIVSNYPKYVLVPLADTNGEQIIQTRDLANIPNKQKSCFIRHDAKCPSEASFNFGLHQNKAAVAKAFVYQGKINKILIIDTGSNYNDKNPPKITVRDQNGEGAILEASIINGEVVKIDVINGGTDYTNPKIIIEESKYSLCCNYPPAGIY